MDRLLRLSLALPRRSGPGPTASAEPKEINKTSNENRSYRDDLIDVYVSGSATFERETREDGDKVLQEIFSHQALEPLGKPAKIMAATYIFQARMSCRLKTHGKYWVLGDLGEVYPHPLAIRAGAFPSWKRQIRTLERMRTELRESASRALRTESDTIVSSDFNQMPANMILNATVDLGRAIEWMQAFPGKVALRSKYREMIAPNRETESVKVVAYVLGRLYREHIVESPLKIKEIECRIAELETTYLGQNIDFGPGFGCPAVRLQIRSVMRSKMRTAVDAQLAGSLRMASERVRRSDPQYVEAAGARFLSRLRRHSSAYHVWWQGTPPKLKADLRRAFKTTTDQEDLAKLVDGYFRQMDNYFDLATRWIHEYDGHLDNLKSPDVDFWQYRKDMRKWMRRWESVWELSDTKESGLEEARIEPKI